MAFDRPYSAEPDLPYEQRVEHRTGLREDLPEPLLRFQVRDACEATDHAEERIEELTADAERQPSAWDSVDATDRPPVDDLYLEYDRAAHILYGDDTGGGHLSGTRQPGKTEFPASWDSTTIVDAVTAVAFSPDTVRQQWNDRWKARGTYDQVPVTVIIDPDAAIRTAWPEEGGPGVVRNPEATPR